MESPMNYAPINSILLEPKMGNWDIFVLEMD